MTKVTERSSAIARFEQIRAKGFNDEDSTNLNEITKAMAAVGIQALDTSGRLRPFADVLDEVGAKYNTLSKNEQAYLVTAMFGTFQRNRGLTLLSNYNQSLKNYENALNSAGVAEKKFTIYQESSQAHLDKLKATMEGFYQNTLSSGFIKGIIDLGTGFVGLVDKFGFLNTAIIATTTYFTLFKTKMFITPVINVATIAVTKLTEGLNWSTKSLIRFNTVMGMFAPMAIATSILAIVAAIKKWHISTEDQRQKVEDLATEYDKLNNTLKETITFIFYYLCESNNNIQCYCYYQKSP